MGISNLHLLDDNEAVDAKTHRALKPGFPGDVLKGNRTPQLASAAMGGMAGCLWVKRWNVASKMSSHQRNHVLDRRHPSERVTVECRRGRPTSRPEYS